MSGALIEYNHDIEMRKTMHLQPSGRASHLESALMPPPTIFGCTHASLKRTLSQREDGGATTRSSTQPPLDSPDPSSSKRSKLSSDSNRA